jgi:Rrf2 family protein
MITSRGRYALKVMIDLSSTTQNPKQRRQDISERQSIPSDYMDHILASLRESGLIESVRGRNGGLQLARPANEISVWDIFHAAEQSMAPVACLEEGDGCMTSNACSTKGAWSEIYEAMKATFSSFDLATLTAKYGNNVHNFVEVVEGVTAPKECRGPRKVAGASA